MPIFQGGRERELDYVNQRLTNIEAFQRVIIWLFSAIGGLLGFALLCESLRLHWLQERITNAQISYTTHLQTVEDLKPYERITKLENLAQQQTDNLNTLTRLSNSWIPLMDTVSGWIKLGKFFLVIVSIPGVLQLGILIFEVMRK